jgi:hypothetical protein
MIIAFAAYRACSDPTVAGDEWLEKLALDAWIWSNSNDRRARLLIALQAYLDDDGAGGPGKVVEALEMLAGRPDAADVQTRLRKLTSGRKIAPIAAELTVAAGIDARGKHESHATAVQRIAKIFRKAWTSFAEKRQRV